MSNNATSKIGTMAETYYRLVAIDGSLRRISYYMKGILEDKRDRYYTDSFSASPLHEPPLHDTQLKEFNPSHEEQTNRLSKMDIIHASAFWYDIVENQFWHSEIEIALCFVVEDGDMTWVPSYSIFLPIVALPSTPLLRHNQLVFSCCKNIDQTLVGRYMKEPLL